MAQVGIVMGSDSDLEIMSKAAEMLDKFGISYEMTVPEFRSCCAKK